MNVITGETGAGKSILLGALGLILGNRADTKSLLNVNDKCIVEGIFDVDKLDLKWFFIDNDLDYEPTAIVRREILPSAKSRAFINDTPVSLQILKELGERLIDLNSQHHTLQLNETNFQLTIVDALAKNHAVIERYDAALQVFKKLEKNYNQLRTNEQLLKSEADFVQFMHEELKKLSLTQPNEQSKAYLKTPKI
jgi:DNA repair protein RecN (Recombination protein N)